MNKNRSTKIIATKVDGTSIIFTLNKYGQWQIGDSALHYDNDEIFWQGIINMIHYGLILTFE